MGRAQWMPTVLPGPLPGTKVLLALVILYGAASLALGLLVDHLTGSIGWAFVVVAALFLLGIPILGVFLGRLQRKLIARRGSA